MSRFPEQLKNLNSFDCLMTIPLWNLTGVIYGLSTNRQTPKGEGSQITLRFCSSTVHLLKPVLLLTGRTGAGNNCARRSGTTQTSRQEGKTMTTKFTRNEKYEVTFKGYQFTAVRDFAGFDLFFDEDIDNDGIAVGQELFNLIFDTMEKGHNLPASLLLLDSEGVK